MVRYSYLPDQFSNPEPIFNEIRKLLKSGDFTLGKQVELFEQSFADLIGTRFAVGVGSGTDALKLALEANGVGPGDEVITAANTFIATVGAIHELGAKPVLVDVTAAYTMDARLIKASITSKTRAIVPVHLTGEPADMTAIAEIAKTNGLIVVEDACQAILAEWNGKRVGTFGNAAGFSLHPLKNLNVWGDAGVVVTDDETIAKRVRLLRNHGMKNRDEIIMMGRNSRLDTIQAIVGNWLLPQTHTITEARIRNAAFLDQALSSLKGHVDLSPRHPNSKKVFHLYMFEVNEKIRNALVDYLISAGIEAKVHYPIPLPLQEGLQFLGYKPGDFPVTEMQAKKVISLPVDQHLQQDQLDFMANKIKAFFQTK